MKFLDRTIKNLLFCGVSLGLLAIMPPMVSAGLPPNLEQTGLYSNIKDKIIALENWPFSPQYPLWSDGAVKKRWIYIPMGKKIDSSNPDNWNFPVGTKFWKEFSFKDAAGNFHRVETRYLEKIGEQKWDMGSYQWNSDESQATLVPSEGRANVFPINDRISHRIPMRWDCHSCHGETRPVLGFQALQLSEKRDPNALHREGLTNEMITMGQLLREGKLSHQVNPEMEIPDSPKNPLQKPVMGYFLANCSHCHRPDGYAGGTKLHFDFQSELPLKKQPFLETALNKRTRFYYQGSHRIRTGKPERSTILIRMINGSMPPLATQIPDSLAISTLEKYIKEFSK